MFVNKRQLELLARKNELQWTRVKQVLNNSKEYSRTKLMSMGAKELATLAGTLKAKAKR